MACQSRIRRAAALTLAALVGASMPALATADPGGPAGPPGNTLYVNHQSVSAAAAVAGPAGPARNGCASAAFTSVQSAVDAARPGQTVYLCGTAPYQESVLVQKNLTLTGDPGAALQASPTNPQPDTTFFSGQGLQTPNSVLTVIGNYNVQVQGLTIEGPFENQGCGGDDFGVLQINGGHLRLNNDRVSDVQAADQADYGGCQYGVAIQIGRRYWPAAGGGYDTVNFAGNAEIVNTVVNTYQKNGITVDGPGSQAHVHSSTIDGGGPNATIARNGIQISRGATGELDHNSINDNEYSGSAPASATGVVVSGGCGDPLDTNVQIHDNTLTNDDNGIDISDFDPTCSTAPSTRTNNQVHDNTIAKNDGETNHGAFSDESGNAYTGYQVGITDTGNGDDIHNNSITGTGAAGADTAFGPQTAPGGPFLAPIDIQTYPPIAAKVHGNTYDGQPTNPPYQSSGGTVSS